MIMMAVPAVTGMATVTATAGAMSRPGRDHTSTFRAEARQAGPGARARHRGPAPPSHWQCGPGRQRAAGAGPGPLPRRLLSWRLGWARAMEVTSPHMDTVTQAGRPAGRDSDLG
jgi:hypothetical protein